MTEKLEKVKETLEGEGKERAGGRERSLRERSPSLHRQVVCRRRKGAETNGSSGASTCSEDSDHSNDTFGEWWSSHDRCDSKFSLRSQANHFFEIVS